MTRPSLYSYFSRGLLRTAFMNLAPLSTLFASSTRNAAKISKPYKSSAVNLKPCHPVSPKPHECMAQRLSFLKLLLECLHDPLAVPGHCLEFRIRDLGWLPRPLTEGFVREMIATESLFGWLLSPIHIKACIPQTLNLIH